MVLFSVFKSYGNWERSKRTAKFSSDSLQCSKRTVHISGEFIVLSRVFKWDTPCVCLYLFVIILLWYYLFKISCHNSVTCTDTNCCIFRGSNMFSFILSSCNNMYPVCYPIPFIDSVNDFQSDKWITLCRLTARICKTHSLGFSYI